MGQQFIRIYGPGESQGICHQIGTFRRQTI